MVQVDTYAREYAARQQAKQAVAKEVEFSLDELINPQDVDENAETWEEIDEETLRMEIGESISFMVSEDQIPSIDALAVVLWREDLPRVPMDDLVFNSREKAVKEGYWPYKMNRTEVTEILWEYNEGEEFYNEFRQEAENYLYDVMFDTMHPLKEPDI